MSKHNPKQHTEARLKDLNEAANRLRRSEAMCWSCSMASCRRWYLSRKAACSAAMVDALMVRMRMQRFDQGFDRSFPATLQDLSLQTPDTS
jgi:hypothetical protein